MRQVLCTLVLGLALAANAGCLLPMYSGDPTVRTEELIYTSEDLRTILEEWRRFWFTDMPSHLTPIRVHGGVI